MKKILVTGGTTFVSKYVAEYFVNAGYEVYVLNRNTRPQVQGAKLIEGDRHNLNGILKDLSFDVVADITAYNEKDIVDFVKELGSYEQYIMISSSAVILSQDEQAGVRIFLFTGVCCYGACVYVWLVIHVPGTVVCFIPLF